MKTLLNLFVGIVTQPSILIALIAMLGLLLQKKEIQKLFKALLKHLLVF